MHNRFFMQTGVSRVKMLAPIFRGYCTLNMKGKIDDL